METIRRASKRKFGQTNYSHLSGHTISGSDTRDSVASPQSKIYDSRASILLVGLPGAGKKTLGVIASLGLDRKYIDFESFFEQHASFDSAKFLSTYGAEAYRTMMHGATEKLLTTYAQDCIIGGFDQVDCDALRNLLARLRPTNPIIYVRRDREELRNYALSDDAKSKQRYEARHILYSSSSSHDFHNLSRTRGTVRHRGTLKLKQTETDFTAFLHQVFGRTQRLLQSLPALSATYTYALQAPISWLETLDEYEALDAGADAIDFIVDLPYNTQDLHDRIVRQMAVLRRNSRAPIIFEPRYTSMYESEYLDLLKLAVRCLPDMIAIDMRNDAPNIRSLLPANIEVIGCSVLTEPWSMLHNHHSRLQNKVRQLQCRALRIVYDGEVVVDNFECISVSRSLSQKFSLPVIAYNATRQGQSSICFNRVLSPVLPPSMTTEIGLTVEQAQKALYSSYVLPRQQFFIFGKSVSYSLSPAMHNAGYKASGMPHSYSCHESNQYSDIHQLIQTPECGGIAVSLPYKTEVLPLLDWISPDAQAVGAVNTITIKRRSSSIILEGHNTDHIGIRQCVSENLSPANSIRPTTSALIIGAGGMARAAIYACATLGVKKFCIYNRTYAHAVSLAEASEFDIKVFESLQDDWPQSFDWPTIIISTVPAHRVDGVSGSTIEIPPKWLQSRTGGVLIELAYKPLVTGLFSQFRSLAPRGWIAVDGLEILLKQGIAQFEIFTGRPAPCHVMRRFIQEEKAKMQ